MKKFISSIIIFICLFSIKVGALENNDAIYNRTMKKDLFCLLMGYGEYIKTIEKGTNGDVFIVMNSGNKIIYDDRTNKSVEQKISNPDLQDMMEQVYLMKSINEVVAKNFDPGRIRNYSLLNEVYGRDKNGIEKNIKSFGACTFNKNNGAGESLKRAMDRVIEESKKDKSIGAYVFPISGTYNYRVISGTNRLSPHAYAIAIDLRSHPWDYWKWTSQEQGSKRVSSYSKELVKIFEDNNFIWGGKWNHFDILHFEYRPEVIFKGRLFGQDDNIEKSWYSSLDTRDEKVNKYIRIIEETFK